MMHVYVQPDFVPTNQHSGIRQGVATSAFSPATGIGTGIGAGVQMLPHLGGVH